VGRVGWSPDTRELVDRLANAARGESETGWRWSGTRDNHHVFYFNCVTPK